MTGPVAWILEAIGQVLPGAVRGIKKRILEKNAQKAAEARKNADTGGKIVSECSPVDESELPPVLTKPKAPETVGELAERLQKRYPDLFLQWRRFEDEDLANMDPKTVGEKWDGLGGLYECGFGVVVDEIRDAKRYKVLPQGYPEQLPKFKGYADALSWFEGVTVPTYLGMVAAEVNLKGVRLSDHEWIALASFAHNLGLSNLRTLVSGPNRLLEGVRATMEDLMPKYCRAGGQVAKGLVRRRAWEVAVFYTREAL